MSEEISRQIELRSDRESVPSYIVGFLRASKHAALPHQSLVGQNPSSELMSCALAHLQVFTVRALETFFRDCFVLLCKRDASFLHMATEATKGKLDYVALSSFISGKASLEEHLAAQRNFQNLDVVNLAFEPLFGRPTFDALNDASFSVFIPGDPPRMLELSLKEQPWKAQLYGLFGARHEIIHNSNRALPSDQTAVLAQANTAILVGQLFGCHLASTLRVGTIVTEAPLWMVALMSLSLDTNVTPDELQELVANELANNREFAGGSGHIGPALVLGQHLMQLRFADDHSTTEATVGGRDIVHLLTRIGDELELQTLQGIAPA